MTTKRQGSHMTTKSAKLEFRCSQGLKTLIQRLSNVENITISKYLETIVSEKITQLLIDNADILTDKTTDDTSASTADKQAANMPVNLSDKVKGILPIDDRELSFKITTNNPQIAQIQFELGERVLAMVNQGMKHREIADVWNNEGLLTYDHQLWNTAKVKNFLQTIRGNLKR